MFHQEASVETIKFIKLVFETIHFRGVAMLKTMADRQIFSRLQLLKSF